MKTRSFLRMRYGLTHIKEEKDEDEAEAEEKEEEVWMRKRELFCDGRAAI